VKKESVSSGNYNYIERARKLINQADRKRFFFIDEIKKGKGEDFVREQVDKAMSIMPSKYLSGQPSAKPGTVNDPIAQNMYRLTMEKGNPNNVDPYMFLGAYQLEREAIALTAQLLHHPLEIPQTQEKRKNFNKNDYGGWFLNGGTESIHQAMWIFRNKFFKKRYLPILKKSLRFKTKKDWELEELLDIGNSGWISLYQALQAELNGDYKLPIPKIIVPVNAHFAIIKGADILGFGKKNISYYFLDHKTGMPDPFSLQNVCEETINNGDDIAMIWAVVGDTERGSLADVENLINAAREGIQGKKNELYIGSVDASPEKYQIPILVDAAAQYLFASVMENDPEYLKYIGDEVKLERFPKWNFSVDGVKAIICDPHKNQIPYPASLIILEDHEDIRYTKTEESYLSAKDMETLKDSFSPREQEMAAMHATIPTSKAGYGAVATWAYYVGNGMETIRDRKQKVWKLVEEFKELIEKSKFFELIVPPQSAVIPFRLSMKWIYENEKKIREVVSKYLDDPKHEKKYDLILKWNNSFDDEVFFISNYMIYEKINNNPDNFFFIARSFTLGVLTEKDHAMRKAAIDSRKKFKYHKLEECKNNEEKEKIKKWDTEEYYHLGLMVQIMEHHKEDVIKSLMYELEKAAGSLIAK
jgi:glutamate/tyrosine decarboxylase-like PLP-dependent enzyme